MCTESSDKLNWEMYNKSELCNENVDKIIMAISNKLIKLEREMNEMVDKIEHRYD